MGILKLPIWDWIQRHQLVLENWCFCIGWRLGSRFFMIKKQ